MRLPTSAHTSQPWRMHEVAPDFLVEDVWALPAFGDRGDFARLVELFAALSPEDISSVAARALFAIRTLLGRLFGLDESPMGVGTRAATLRDRLPADLPTPLGPRFASLPFSLLFFTEDEFAAEAANKTMHGVIHLGWVAQPDGTYRGQLAVLVKRNGVLGTVYMAAIRPFRYAIVYPQLLREVERRWARVTA